MQINLLPWSAHVTPALRGLTDILGYPFASLGVDSLTNCDTFIALPLGEKLPLVFKNAKQQLKFAVVELAAQDPRVASQVYSPSPPLPRHSHYPP